jgi:hypothetical protein
MFIRPSMRTNRSIEVGLECLVAGGGGGVGAVRHVVGDGMAEASDVLESEAAGGGGGDQDDFPG